MITDYEVSVAKRTPGCNTKARTSVLKLIYNKIKASKEEGRYEQDVTILGGIEYIHISLTEIIEVAGYKAVKHPKQYARNLLKNIIRNGVIKEYDTGEKVEGSRYTRKIYCVGDINLLLELEEGKEKLTQKYLYPTRCRIALEATEYFIGEAKRNGCCSQEINSPRFFKRIGRILKDFFSNDLEKFKAWVRYIYDHGKKGTFMLLRDNMNLLRLFVLKTFTRIYKKYERSFRMSGYLREEEKREEEKQPYKIIEYPFGTTEGMKPAFNEIHRQLGNRDYKTYVLDCLTIDGDMVITNNNEFHWKVSCVLSLFGVKYGFPESDNIDNYLNDYLAL